MLLVRDARVSRRRDTTDIANSKSHVRPGCNFGPLDVALTHPSNRCCSRSTRYDGQGISSECCARLRLLNLSLGFSSQILGFRRLLCCHLGTIRILIESRSVCTDIDPRILATGQLFLTGVKLGVRVVGGIELKNVVGLGWKERVRELI